MRIGLRHVVAVSALLAVGAFVYVVGFAPMDETASPRAGAIGREPSRELLIANVRRSLALGQVSTADRIADVLVKHNPEDPGAIFWRALVDRAVGDADASRARFGALDVQLDGLESWAGRYSDDQLEYYRAWAKFGIGEIEVSRALFAKIADDLEDRASRDKDGEITSSGVLYNLACYRAMSGEGEAAIGLWERAVENGYGEDGGWWAVDPDLESLHSNDRFWGISGQIQRSERDSERVLIEASP